MLQYFAKRFLALIPKILIITMLIFIGLELIPGDTLSRTMSPDAYSILTDAQKEQLREAKGLNDPAVIRYFRWLGDIARGDFGYSTFSNSSVNALLTDRVPATLELMGIGLLYASIFGLLFGYIAAIKKNTVIDYFITTTGMLGISVPNFFFGMLFILFFAVQLKWFPTGGRSGVDAITFFQKAKYYVLPGLCMGVNLIANLMRFTRNSMLDVMGRNYMKTARAKGLSETQVNIKHCFRNGCAPVVIFMLGRLSYLVSGAIVIETIFNYPGTGTLMITAVKTADAPLAMSILLIISLAVLSTTFLSDIVLALLDPRVRFEKELVK